MVQATRAPIILRARRVVTPSGQRAADVVVSGESITEVTGYGSIDGTPIIDVDDACVLLPGLVDTHVHVNEPGRTEWEGFGSATAAAAAGGITTIADMPLNSIPATVDLDALKTKRQAASGQLAVDVALWGGAVPGNVGQLRPMHEAGVIGFKCFLLDSGVPEFAPLGPPDLTAAMSEIASFDGLLIAHAEDGPTIDSAPSASGRQYADFVASRPAEAEVTAIRGLLAAAARTGCRVHVVHLASALSLPLIGAAKQAGIQVTAETCPHYLSLVSETVPDGATEYKCCPPIRDAANRNELWGGLQSGVIDLVVSDHSPCTPGLKHPESGDFGAAWGGIASLQLALPIVWTEARRRGIGLDQLVSWMAARPAALAGLRDRGEIAAGKRADFAIFAPDDEFVVDPALLRHRHPVSPYAGQRLHGVVRQTWLAGAPIVDGALRGRLVTRSPHGRSQP